MTIPTMDVPSKQNPNPSYPFGSHTSVWTPPISAVPVCSFREAMGRPSSPREMYAVYSSEPVPDSRVTVALSTGYLEDSPVSSMRTVPVTSRLP